jgi:hypothetical protein
MDIDRAWLASLVEDGRVRTEIYTDPSVFDAEMERIFARTWVYVAHESEIGEPGDYKTVTVGTQPVIVACRRDRSCLAARSRRAGRDGVETQVLEARQPLVQARKASAHRLEISLAPVEARQFGDSHQLPARQRLHGVAFTSLPSCFLPLSEVFRRSFGPGRPAGP